MIAMKYKYITSIQKGWPESLSPADKKFKSGKANVLKDDMHFPLLVLKDSVLKYNIQAMSKWCKKHGFMISPHGKTTMCPRIFDAQMKAGAWGITVANSSQAMVALRFSTKRILIANQLVGKGNIDSLKRKAKQFWLWF